MPGPVNPYAIWLQTVLQGQQAEEEARRQRELEDMDRRGQFYDNINRANQAQIGIPTPTQDPEIARLQGDLNASMSQFRANQADERASIGRTSQDLNNQNLAVIDNAQQLQRWSQEAALRQQPQAPTMIAPPPALAGPQGPPISGMGTAATAAPHGPPARPMNPNLITAPAPAGPIPMPTPSPRGAPDPFNIPPNAVMGGQMPAAPLRAPMPWPAPAQPLPQVPIPQPAPDPRVAAALSQARAPAIIGPPPGFTPPAGGASPAPAGFRNPGQVRSQLPAPTPNYGYRSPPVDLHVDNSQLPAIIAAQRFLDAWPAQPPPAVEARQPPSVEAPPQPRVAPEPPAPPIPIPPNLQPKPDPATAPRLGQAMPEALKEQLLAEAMRIVRERAKPEGAAPGVRQPTLGPR